MGSTGRATHDQLPSADRFALTIPYAPVDGVSAPAALPLLPGGALVQGRDGRAYKHLNPLKTLQAMEATYADYPMVLDENHSEEFKAPNGEPTNTLARLAGFALRADGSIWATQIDWTPYGLERIAQRAYVGVSPTVLFDTTRATEQDGVSIDGEITTLAGASLVNSPNFVMPALHAIHAKDSKMTEEQIKKAIADALAPFLALKDDMTAKIADMSVQFQGLIEGSKAEAAAVHAKRVDAVLGRAVHAKKIAPASKAYHAKRLNTAEDLAEFETTYLGGESDDVVSNERPARGTHAKSKALHSSASKDKARIARDLGVTEAELDADDDTDEDEE